MYGWRAQDYHSWLDEPIAVLIVATMPQGSLAIENIAYVPRLDKTCLETIPARHKLPCVAGRPRIIIHSLMCP